MGIAMSYNHLLDRLMEAVGGGADPVPKGWFTVEQFRDEIGKAPRTTATILAKMLKNKVVERRKFRVFNESHGCIYPTVHYREIKR